MFPDYEIRIVSRSTGNVVQVYGPAVVTEIRYSVQLNGVGSLAVAFLSRANEVSTSQFSLDYIQSITPKDTFIDVIRDGIIEGTYLVSSFERGLDGTAAEYLVIGALSLEHLIARRILDPRDDSVQPNGGYVTKAGPADTILRALLREQMGDLASSPRVTQGLYIPPTPGTGSGSGIRRRYENLLGIVQTITNASDIDILMQRSNGTQIDVTLAPRGTDQTYGEHAPLGPYLVFAQQRGNLSNPAILWDSKEERSVVYVLGPGEGSNRALYVAINSQLSAASPFGRSETVSDLRQSTPNLVTELIVEGQNKLQELAAEIKFNFAMNPSAGGALYRTDWIVGDYCSVVSGEIIRDVRITSAEFFVGVDGEIVTVKFEDKI